MKDPGSKKIEKKSKKNTNPDNKKHRDNKTLKARYILEKNKAAAKRESESADGSEISSRKKTFRIIKNTVLVAVVVVLAVVLISVVVVKLTGGTPTVFGYSIQRISSGSMEPELLVGDIILSKEVSKPEDIAVDDIITYQGGSQFEYNTVTHRVVVAPTPNGSDDYYLITKGDANVDVDPEIYLSDVKSKYVTKLDFLIKFYNFFLSPWGLLIFIGALIAIFFDEILTVAKVLTGNYDDEEEENIREIMDRLKREEVEEFLRREAEKERKRRNRAKYDSTSKKKKELLKRREKQLKKLQARENRTAVPEKKRGSKMNQIKKKKKNKRSSGKKR